MTDKSRRNAKNVNLILDDDKPPEPRPVPRVSETPATQVKTDQNHFYYMFFGTKFFPYSIPDSLFLVSICIAVLSQSNYLPEFTEAQRLIAAYVLGMMTILLIRSA